jgi:hypothetical protein
MRSNDQTGKQFRLISSERANTNRRDFSATLLILEYAARQLPTATPTTLRRSCLDVQSLKTIDATAHGRKAVGFAGTVLVDIGDKLKWSWNRQNRRAHPKQ